MLFRSYPYPNSGEHYTIKKSLETRRQNKLAILDKMGFNVQKWAHRFTVRYTP